MAIDSLSSLAEIKQAMECGKYSITKDTMHIEDDTANWLRKVQVHNANGDYNSYGNSEAGDVIHELLSIIGDMSDIKWESML